MLTRRSPLRVSPLVAATLLAAATVAGARAAHAENLPDPTVVAAEEAEDAAPASVGAARAKADAIALEQAKADSPYGGFTWTIPVYIHVLRMAGGVGDMPVVRAKAITLDRINTAFVDQGIPFKLELKGIDYTTTTDVTLYKLEFGDNAGRKRLIDLLNKGGRDAANIYLTGYPGHGPAGWATFLRDGAIKRDPNIFLRYWPENQDTNTTTTALHEMGHWLGLDHTFQGGCADGWGGDGVLDTVAQKAGYIACDDRDSCPTLPGKDMVDNIMGYDHACRGHFTPGQIARMSSLYYLTRSGKFDGAEGYFEDDGGDEDEGGGCAVAGGDASTGAAGGAALLGLALASVLGRRRRR